MKKIVNTSDSDYLLLCRDLEVGFDKKWLRKIDASDLFMVLMCIDGVLSEARQKLYSSCINPNKLIQDPFDEMTKTTLLLKAVSLRKNDYIHFLFSIGGNYAITDSNGYNILETALLGRGQEDWSKTYECEMVIYEIETLKPDSLRDIPVRKWIKDSVCTEYLKSSLYIKGIIGTRS